LTIQSRDDVSVTGVDDITLAEVVEPPLTTVQQPIRDITRLAAGRLIEINGGLYFA